MGRPGAYPGAQTKLDQGKPRAANPDPDQPATGRAQRGTGTRRQGKLDSSPPALCRSAPAIQASVLNGEYSPRPWSPARVRARPLRETDGLESTGRRRT